MFFGAHLRMPRPSDAVLSGWHAVNCLREWRGDTHWALVVAAGLTGMAQTAARHWLRATGRIPKSEAARLVGSLGWRGISNFPLSHPPA